MLLLEFINTNLSLKDERTTGDTYEEIIKQSINVNDSSTQEQTQNITNIIDKVNSKIKASTGEGTGLTREDAIKAPL